METTTPSTNNWLPDNLHQDVGQFKVYDLAEVMKPDHGPVVYNRRDFYKITLFRGQSIYHYADRSLEVSGSNLLFFSPKVPYTLHRVADGNTGYFCIFTEAFFRDHSLGHPGDLPMFKPGSKPFYALQPEEETRITAIYDKIREEMASDYLYKYDLIRNYVTELIHFALKLQPSETLYKHPDANSRITAVFTELLERQFPIESSSQRFQMRSAKDFAEELSVHVNHLNRAVKETTGKTTTHHIAERISREARALLKHTNWNVAEIAYSLGFEEASHFNNFFKKLTGVTPSGFRLS
jgi:AraC family transcriptional regulator, transcriptional activator of pobA